MNTENTQHPSNLQTATTAGKGISMIMYCSEEQLKVRLPDANAYLWFYIQQSDFALLMDLLDGLNFGTKHISLEATILK